MNTNDMPIGNTIFDRVVSVLGNSAIRPERTLQQPYMAFTAIPPVVVDYFKANQMAKDVAKYNKGLSQKQALSGVNNDTYFHQHAMYQAAQQGLYSALAAALAGELKEKYWDGPQKIKDGKSEEDIEADTKKDLKNNYLAIKMALQSNKPVDKAIVANPTVQKIRDLKSGKK